MYAVEEVIQYDVDQIAQSIAMIMNIFLQASNFYAETGVFNMLADAIVSPPGSSSAIAEFVASFLKWSTKNILATYDDLRCDLRERLIFSHIVQRDAAIRKAIGDCSSLPKLSKHDFVLKSDELRRSIGEALNQTTKPVLNDVHDALLGYILPILPPWMQKEVGHISPPL